MVEQVHQVDDPDPESLVMLLDAELIRSLRHSRGYSQRQAADHLGVSIGVVRSLEEGINHDELPLRLIARIADLFGVPTTTLFTTPTPTDQNPASLTAEIGTIKWIHARQGLSPTEARLLDEHRRGALSTQNFNADEHIAYARLINAGVVTPDASHEQPD